MELRSVQLLNRARQASLSRTSIDSSPIVVIFANLHQQDRAREAEPEDAMIRIDIGKDFSKVTGGRRRDSGAHSAEAFRDDLLVPALLRGGQVVVDITGPSYSMAWLEEAFGPLQDLGFTREDLSVRLQIEAAGDYRYTAEAIRRYILRSDPIDADLGCLSSFRHTRT